MKKLITATVLLLAIAALPLSHLLLAHPPGKVPICHKGYVIVVSNHAVGKHIANHNDCEVFAVCRISIPDDGALGVHCACPGMVLQCDEDCP